MAQLKAGIITAAEVEAPNPVGATPRMKWLDLKAPSTWMVIFFVLAILYLTGV